MKLSYRIFAEFIGTLALVLIGCGSAVIANSPTITGGNNIGFLGISLAFGLTVTCLAYAVGGISGGHFNPAVTLSQVLLKNTTAMDGLYYVIAQIGGAFTGSALLLAILGTNTGQFGANKIQEGFNPVSGFIGELVFSFLFIYVIIGVTSSYSHNKFAPLAIGLMLVLCHIILIPVTGTSVNPARSLAPAVFSGGEYLNQVWIFIIAPLFGSSLAVLASMLFTPNGETDM
jgi:aquaporin Z